MSWLSGTTVSGQAHAHFGDILGNVVHVHQYSRTDPLNSEYMSAMSGNLDGVQPNLKQRKLHELDELNDADATSALQMSDSRQYEDVNAILRTTYEAALSENAVLHHKIAVMYEQLSNFTEHLHRSDLVTGNILHRTKRGTRRRRSTNGPQKLGNEVRANGNKREHDMAPAVAARAACSENEHDHVSATLSGPLYGTTRDTDRSSFDSPYCLLAQSGSCYAEFYNIDAPSNRIFVTHIVQHGTTFQNYFMTFQRTDRRWVRAKASITFDRAPETTSLIRSRVPGHMGSSHRVPCWLEKLSQKIVETTDRGDIRVSLALNSGDREDALAIENSAKLSIAEDVMERTVSTDEAFIQGLRSQKVPQLRESALIVLHRFTIYRFAVLVNGNFCDFRMVPFTNRTKDKTEFKRTLQCLVRLRGCPRIAQVIAFVTDQDGFHLRGYCFESAVPADVMAVLSIAKRIGRPIPWSIRLQWIREIVIAIAEVYDRKIAIGPLRILNVGLGHDHQIILDPEILHESMLTESTVIGRFNQGIPESAPKPEKNTDTLDLRQREAMFQLSEIIWQVAEQIDTVGSYYCKRAFCISKPRYLCQAKHTNPQYLPYCVDAPSFINDIIRMCRSQDVKQRPTAREILKMLSQCSEDLSEAVDLDGELAWHIRRRNSTFIIYCDECNNASLPGIDCFYHCSICFEDDFDLCENCYGKEGIRCLDSNHTMTKTIMQDGISYALS